MMKKTLPIILLSLLTSSVMMGQESAKNRMNSIKKDAAYLYGEATLLTENDAVRLAADLLKDEIKKWSEENNISYEVLPECILAGLADTLIATRGNHSRALVCVKRSDLPSVFSGIQPSAKAPASPKTPAEKETTNANATPDPKEARTPVEANMPSSASPVSKRTSIPDTAPVRSASTSNPVLDRIRSITSFYDLEDIICPLHQQGLIKSYGKYATMQSPSDCYLIIYDPNGYIKAFLGKGIEQRLNLNTKQIDSEHNYPGCGAIWIQLGENN